MDDVSDIFSPEALRLLEESGIDYEAIFQSEELTVDHESSTAATQCEARKNQKISHSLQRIPGCATVSLGEPAKPKRKRAKFDIKAREKVLWNPYLQSNIANDSDFPCSLKQYDRILRTNDLILVGTAKRNFDPEIHWDIGSIALDCARWVLDEHVKPGSNSRVWMLSSLKAEPLLSTFVDGNLSKALRVLVETSSILYNWGMDTSYSNYSSSDLWSIRSFAGSQVLHGLERALNVQRLASASADVLKALFLVLLGTIIAVGYSTSVSHSNELIAKKKSESPRMTANAFEQAQKELLRILAHHIIRIAERAQVLDSQIANCHILENAYRLWSGKAVFEWEIVHLDGPTELEEDSNLFASYSSAHNTQEVGLTGMTYRQSPRNVNPASLGNSLSDTVSSDNYYQGSNPGIIGATENPMLGQCFSCNKKLDADGLCRLCLSIYLDVTIDGSADDLGDPLPSLTISDIQTSADMPYLEEDWNWSVPLYFPAETMVFQTLLSCHCAPQAEQLEVGEADEATQINPPVGSDSHNCDECLEPQGNQHRVKDLTKRMSRKLLV